jgi:hypothetical protein
MRDESVYRASEKRQGNPESKKKLTFLFYDPPFSNLASMIPNYLLIQLLDSVLLLLLW